MSTESEYQTIVVDIQHKHVTQIILNKAERRNCLDEQMMVELDDALNRYSADNQSKTLVITGAGGHFCTGMDLAYMERVSRYDIMHNRSDSNLLKKLFLSIYNCQKVTIALVRGFALAGGCGIASACDFIVASDTAHFGYTEVKIGFIPALAMVFLLKRIREADARDLLLSSKIIDAAEAFRIGLVNHVVPDSLVDSFVDEICNHISQLPTSSVILTKEMLRNLSSMSLEAGLDYAAEMNALTRMTEACQLGMQTFLRHER